MAQKLKLLILPLLLLLSTTAWATDYSIHANVVAVYKFTSDWGAGDIPDVSTNSNDITNVTDGDPDFLNSSPVSFNDTGSGAGYADLITSDAYASYSSSIGDTDFSVTFWCNRDNQDNFDRLLHYKDEFQVAFTSSGEIHVAYVNSSAATIQTETGTASNDCTTSTWTHIGIAFDEDNVSHAARKFYINGVEDDGASGGTFGLTQGTANRIQLGARASAAYYDGQTDEIGIWGSGTLLTSTQINEIFDFGITGAAAAVAFRRSVLWI